MLHCLFWCGFLSRVLEGRNGPITIGLEGDPRPAPRHFENCFRHFYTSCLPYAKLDASPLNGPKHVAIGSFPQSADFVVDTSYNLFVLMVAHLAWSALLQLRLVFLYRNLGAWTQTCHNCCITLTGSVHAQCHTHLAQALTQSGQSPIPTVWLPKFIQLLRHIH